ncbi:tRNA-splicing endonuclease subunit sen54 N-term-domain-containing protein [Myxozyma melibiosi]|uniref:tRNA-splicing endonuclease subunit sen54 N-term-domain-containing protein n=1 Tax=Myxozyma melibiosi TaxID=54550 RepID=A0ABR1FDM4_9ASCO
MDDLDKDCEDSPLPQNGRGGEHDDDGASDDEQQDWRLLAAYSGASKKSLPKRGEKEYEPDGSHTDSSNLEQSRTAMYTALSGERKHTSKAHISGIWFPSLGKARVISARGPHFKAIGKADSTGTIFLLPEETIYLVERGSMTLYNSRGDTSISLQGCYGVCLKACGGHERYLVYAYLKRLGFNIQRASTFDNEGVPELPVIERKWSWASFWSSIMERCMSFWSGASSLFAKRIAPFGPVVHGGVWRSYSSIYRKLQIIPYESHKNYTPPVAKTEVPFRVTYNIWKPRPSFKKSAPGEPDFQIVVVNAAKEKMPSYSQLRALFTNVPPSARGGKGTENQRLKEGYRNVLIAVVDCGIISFVRLGDTSFGDETIYERSPRNMRKGQARARPAASAKKT